MEKEDNDATLKTNFIPLMLAIYGVAVLISIVSLVAVGAVGMLRLVGSILLISTPLLLGIISIGFFARGGLAFGDRYSIMNTSAAFALCILAIAEGTFLALQNSATTEIGNAVFYTVASIGFLPWVASVISYLRQSNEVLGFFSEENVKYTLVICSVVCPLPAILIIAGLSENTGLSVIIAAYPLFSMAFLLVLTLGLISWMFRKGQLIRPLLSIFAGVTLVVIHLGMQSFSELSGLLALNLLAGIEGYTLIGISLLLAQRMIENV